MLVPITHILPLTSIQRTRLLPLQGEVLVRAGQKVRASDVIATTDLSPQHTLLDVARALDVAEDEAGRYIEREPNDEIEAGDIIASRKGFGKRILRSPVNGTISVIAGAQIIIRGKTKPYELLAGLPGTVTNLIPDQGAEIVSTGALIQGLWGNGKVDFGLMNVIATDPEHILTSDQIDVSMRGSIVLAGHCEEADTLRDTAEQRIRGLILASMPSELEALATKMPYPIILTDGFGNFPMNQPAFKLLSTNDKRDVAMNAEPFNRDKGVRPEILIPLPGTEDLDFPSEMEPLSVGHEVRIIRAPHYGKIATVETIHPGLTMFPSGIRAAAARVRIEDEGNLDVPLTNLEILG